MIKFYSSVTALLLSVTAAFAQTKTAADYVNPMIGATSSTELAGSYHGLGKTFPGATTPYGMVQVSPNTITGGDNGSGYSDEHTSIEGFAFTQMSGIGWYGDLGNFLVMPTTGKMFTNAGKIGQDADGYRSHYVKSSEKAEAGFYSVYLDKYKVKADMTAEPHSGMLRFTYPASDMARVQIDLGRRVGGTSTRQYIKVVDDYTIQGWMKCTPEGGGWGNGDGKADYTVYFYTKFNRPLKDFGVWSADIPAGQSRKLEAVTSDAYQQMIAKAKILAGVTEKEGDHLGFYTQFDTHAGEQVMVKSGISFVSMEGARKNLEAEIPDWDFEAQHKHAKELWNNALARVSVTGGTDDEKTIFYTALYHTMIDPRIVSDVDGSYTGGDGKAHTSTSFQKRTIFSGWDVFRSQMPLQTIINPALVTDMINSLVTLADEKGMNYLERWELLNAYSGCMLGNPAVSVIADAYAKGLRNFDVDKAYKLSVGSVEKFGNGDRGYTVEGFGISHTLEYAYTDWCVATMAKALNKKDDYIKYKKRGEAYRNIFDPEKKWFRPRTKDGSWEPWPAEGRLKQWYGCIESNPYQQGWFVPQDVPGMVRLMGGNKAVMADLVTFFEKVPDNMYWNDYYNHANEPVHHVPFLFNRIGYPALTQKWTREITRRAYKNSVAGLVGNEDVGQMSAWYVLAAGGLHPVCPGDTRQEITSPSFNKVVYKVAGGTFTIDAKNNSAKNIYIQRARLNGKPYNKCYIDYSEVVAGGHLELVMGPKPSAWGKN